MEGSIRSEIILFVKESPLNRFQDSEEPYFDEPLVGFSSANDCLYSEYKTVIGAFHQTPQEVIEGVFGSGATACSVISWILPITKETRRSNRNENIYPSKEWARTRHFGEALNAELRRHIVEWLGKSGHQSVAPQLASSWQEFADTPVGIASNWSERHAAYAAGLGTFCLNDALITPKGIGHRCGSVVTSLKLTPSEKPYPNHLHNCLYFRNGSCGLCIARCPIGALSTEGHDKAACSVYVYQKIVDAVAGAYGVTATGCGLCQTKVPCENGIPPGL